MRPAPHVRPRVARASVFLLAAAAIVVAGCRHFAEPTEDGGPRVSVRLGEQTTPAGWMGGLVRVDLVGFGQKCPGAIGPLTPLLRTSTASLEAPGDEVAYELEADELVRLHVRHQGGPRKGGEICGRKIWLRPGAGASFAFRFDTRFESCELVLESGRAFAPSLASRCEELEEPAPRIAEGDAAAEAGE